MKPLVFCLLIAASFVLQCVLVNSAQNISNKSTQVISIFLLCLSLVFLSSVLILWLFTPYRPRSKLPSIFLSLNFIISLTSNAIFSIFYHQQYSITYIYPIFSFLYTLISIAIALLFERPNVDEGTSRITPIPQEQINIELKTTTFILDEPLNCSICLEEFIKDEEVKITHCNHLFHLQCSKDLVNNKIKSCPICRGDLTLSIESVQESHRTVINISPSP